MLAVRKALGILVSVLALAGVLVTGVLATRRIDQRPRTDDAYLQADLVHMAPDAILTALLAGIAVVLAIFVTIAVFMLSLSEPALRIPLMAART